MRSSALPENTENVCSNCYQAHAEKAASLIGPRLTVSSFGFLECFALAPNAIGFLGVWIGSRARAAVSSVKRLRMSANAHFIALHETLK